MRDRDVRNALLSRLAETYDDDPATRVVQEMGVWSGSARVDVAVINGELLGFELKSERDTLDRLPLQAEIYGLVFDRMYLVTAEKHLEKAANIIPNWWGAWTAAKDGDGRIGIQSARAGSINVSQDPKIIADLLWRWEAIQLLDEYELARGMRSKPIKALHHRLAECLRLDDLKLGVRNALKARTEWLR